jgi:hypothetical protein
LRRWNAYAYGDGFADTDAHTDFNAYSDGHVDSHADGNTYTDGDSDRFAIGDAHVRAWGHTWAVEHVHTRTECSLSLWWNDRWNLRLRVRWPNLHRRLPK